MKKTINLMLAMAALFLSASCQKDVLTHDPDKADAVVTFNVNVPEGIQTKAISDGTGATVLYYEVWNGTNIVADATAEIVNYQAVIDFKLVRGLQYTFIFWAQHQFAPYTVTDLKAIKMNYLNNTTGIGNDEKRDAFYGVIENLMISDDIAAQSVTLKRPFAQLNFGASDMFIEIEGVKTPITVTKTSINVKNLSTTFNPLTPSLGDNNAEATFNANEIITTEDLKVNSDTYKYISMNYLLFSGEDNTVDVTADFDISINETALEPASLSFDNLPVKRNYRTNIIGNLFTEESSVAILLDPDYEAGTDINNENVE